MAVNLEEVLKLAEQLDTDQQNLLIYRLRVGQPRMRAAEASTTATIPRRYSDQWINQRGTEYIDGYRNPSRQDLLQAVEMLRATPPRAEDRLLGKYASPTGNEMSEEALHAQLHAIATEWEPELDEFTDHS